VEKSADAKGAYCLMIDAGKGTTDFSILHQVGNVLSHYESVYRSGIPASGHVLTYAFYEALRDYFKSIDCGDKFEKIIRSAYSPTLQTKPLLDFLAQLEERKANYGEYKNPLTDEYKNEVQSVIVDWTSLKQFLVKLNREKVIIPNEEEKVNKKVQQMVHLLESSIKYYAQKRKITFLKVYLSGRAFMFEPFRKAVINSLIQNNLVQSEKNIVYTEDSAKTACLDGSIEEGAYTVNRKSTMLSVPSMQEVVEDTSKKRRFLPQWLRDLIGHGVKMASIDFDFFYKGLSKNNVQNVNIDICGRVERFGSDIAEDIHLYFIGDGYLLKSDSTSRIIDESCHKYAFSENNLKLLNQLTRESLFPFDLASMGYQEESTSSTPSGSGDNSKASPTGNKDNIKSPRGSGDGTNATGNQDEIWS
jgi:hypothetical protein